MPDFTARITEILRKHCASEVRESLFSSRTYVECYGCSKPFRPEEFNDHIAPLIAKAAEEHYRPRVETVEQLDALPEDVVVMFARGDVATKEPTRRDGWHWFRIGCYDSGPATDLDLPATVLWSPGAGE